MKEIKKEEIIKLFTDGKNCCEIAKQFNCNPETIRLKLKKLGVDTSRKMTNINCINCGGSTQKHGKSEGKYQRYKCNICGKLFTENVQLLNNNRKTYHDEIIGLYLNDGLSTVEIGRILGTSSTVPQRILKKYGLTRDISLAKEYYNANAKGLSYNEYIESLPIFKRYRKRVVYHTNKQSIDTLPNYDKIRGLSGTLGCYQLDHKYSILEGFKNDVDPKIIGNINNLEFIPWEDNIKKGTVCSITLDKLLTLINDTDIKVRVKTA